MRIVQITGVPKSGKTTVFLNCRKSYGRLFSERRFDQVEDVMFIGSGLMRSEYRRLVGGDSISRNIRKLTERVSSIMTDAFECGLDPDVPNVFLIDSYRPVIDYELMKEYGIDVSVRLCKTSFDELESRNSKCARTRMIEQRRLIKELNRTKGIDLGIWDGVPLKEMVNDVMSLLGGRAVEKVVHNFKSYHRRVIGKTDVAKK